MNLLLTTLLTLAFAFLVIASSAPDWLVMSSSQDVSGFKHPLIVDGELGLYQECLVVQSKDKDNHISRSNTCLDTLTLKGDDLKNIKACRMFSIMSVTLVFMALMFSLLSVKQRVFRYTSIVLLCVALTTSLTCVIIMVSKVKKDFGTNADTMKHSTGWTNHYGMGFYFQIFGIMLIAAAFATSFHTVLKSRHG